MGIKLHGNGQLKLYVAWDRKPWFEIKSSTDKKSLNLLENHLPIKRMVKYLICSRMRFGLSMEDIKRFEHLLRAKQGTVHTWGSNGNVQVFPC